jgi:hypothetical protein
MASKTTRGRRSTGSVSELADRQRPDQRLVTSGQRTSDDANEPKPIVATAA